MISRSLAHLKLRNRLLGTTVCTTGSTDLVATTTGYTRAAGSFVTDGFAVGQEITPAGFPANPVDVITSVTATEILTASAHAAASTGSGRSLTVGIPAGRAFDNVAFTPTPGRPYIEEDFVPATTRLRTVPAASAYAEDTGLYVVKWYGLSGTDMLAIARCADAVLARFTPGTSFTLSDSTTLRIPTEFGPRAGQITPTEGGWSYVAIEIPYIGESTNAIAA